MEHELVIPQTGCANWMHYYFCPDCSVKLIHDLDKPHEHECPVCHKVFSDELKDGAWWRLVNTFNETSSFHAGLYFQLTGDERYARRAIEVLLGYAENYPDFEVHGNIPYNGPGRLNAQILDEANFLRNMGYTYDVVEEVMSEEEKRLVKENLFRVGIEFLKAGRHDQLHNHEVVISGAIGVLALILSDKESLEFAIDSRYGIRYQLEHGVLSDGYWFECSTAYHFYALQNLFLYEKFARHTRYSCLDHPSYERMLLAALRLLKTDMSFPLLNDCHLEQGDPNGYNLYEFAYSIYRRKELLPVMEYI